MKSKIYLKASLIIFIACFSMNSYGQETEPAKKKELRTFYRRTLQVDSAKADQVGQVQDSYKASLKLLMADTSVTPAGRILKIQSLMEEKNQQLRKLLTPAQQEKMIPSSERLNQPLKKD